LSCHGPFVYLPKTVVNKKAPRALFIFEFDVACGLLLFPVLSHQGA
jgi:hypothetical protein